MYKFLKSDATNILDTHTHTFLFICFWKLSSKYLQRKCNGQDHGEVPVAHWVVAQGSGWDT